MGQNKLFQILSGLFHVLYDRDRMLAHHTANSIIQSKGNGCQNVFIQRKTGSNYVVYRRHTPFKGTNIRERVV